MQIWRACEHNLGLFSLCGASMTDERLFPPKLQLGSTILYTQDTEYGNKMYGT